MMKHNFKGILVFICFALVSVGVSAQPPFSKVFNPSTIAQGDTSQLTLVINNNAFGAPTTNLDVTDPLPAGMVIASPPNAVTTCTGGTLTAVAGASVISYTGGTAPANAFCQIDVDIEASTTGALVNTTGDLTSSAGNSGPASATLTVTAAPPSPSTALAIPTLPSLMLAVLSLAVLSLGLTRLGKP